MNTRHGEYKVPGGKLVVVDLQEHDGRLAHVQVAGDFFLEPDSALDDIRQALEGQPITADTAQLAAAIGAALIRTSRSRCASTSAAKKASASRG